MIPNFLNAEKFALAIEKIFNDKGFQKSDTEIETIGSEEKFKFPQEDDDEGIFILDAVNEKQINDPRVEAMFKRSRHNNLSIILISQDYYELPKRTFRANGNIYHIFRASNFRYVQNLQQDKFRWL